MGAVSISTVADFPTEPTLCKMTVFTASTGLPKGKSGRFSFAPKKEETIKRAYREGDGLYIEAGEGRFVRHDISQFPNIIIFLDI